MLAVYGMHHYTAYMGTVGQYDRSSAGGGRNFFRKFRHEIKKSDNFRPFSRKNGLFSNKIAWVCALPPFSEMVGEIVVTLLDALNTMDRDLIAVTIILAPFSAPIAHHSIAILVEIQIRVKSQGRK